MTKGIDQKNGLGKVCTKCGDCKPTSEFYKHSGTKDGLRGTCKECDKERMRIARLLYPDHARELDKKSRIKNKEAKRERDKEYRRKNQDKANLHSKKWKAANPEKVKGSNARYREKNRDKIREKQREYNREHYEDQREWHKLDRKLNPEKVRAKDKRRRERNKEKINNSNLEYMKDRYLNDAEYREERKAKAREYGKIWRQEKKDLARSHVISRRARLAGAEGKYIPEDIERINRLQGYECVYCGTSTKTDFHIDHKTPLSRGGSNWPDNLQVLCQHCNVSKWSRTHEEYVEWRARLAPDNDNKKSFIAESREPSQ